MIDALLAKGMVPDYLLRKGIKKLLAQRLNDEYGKSANSIEANRKEIIEELGRSPIAIKTGEANDQHYMVPPEFYVKCLGPQLKYSCCHWENAKNLTEAEDEMLKLTIKRAGIKDGDKILELGHGWGAITLYLAKHFPNSEILAISNSSFQGQYILKQAQKRGLTNIRIQTANVTNFNVEEKFDRVISVEMFEHMRNYKSLLKNINKWLKPKGTLFVQIFAHKEIAYKFEVKDPSDWMSKYFFSGGIMPSEHLFYYFQDDLVVREHWRINGNHYAKTAKAWLDNMDAKKQEIIKIFKEHYKGDAKKWFEYWRVFYMSCEELFNFKKGNEWFVAHYLFEKKYEK